MRLFFLFLFFLCSSGKLAAQNFGGNPSSQHWFQLNTKKTRVIFSAGSNNQAIRVAKINQLLSDSTAGSIGGHQKKWPVMLQNQLTIPNAYVRLAPVMSELYMTPGQNNFSNGSIRWEDNLMIHENRHIQQFSNFNKGFTRFFTFLLGQEGQLLANGMTIPNYFFEGDAVWQETLVSKQGRGRMPSFYNGFKSLWIDKRNYSWMKLRNGSFKNLIPDHYALGYLLTAYGYEKYGSDFWNAVTGDAIRFKGLFYSYNRAVQQYSGKSYSRFAADALLYFKAKSFPVNLMPENNFKYITREQKNNVVDYQFPFFIGNDTILVSRKSRNTIPAFVMLLPGREKTVRIRNLGIDDYYSYKKGKIVYAAYQTDPRWQNRDYSVIQLLDIYTGKQQQLTHRTKYFSPDIHEDGHEILAVQVLANGTSQLVRLDAISGNLILEVPNPKNYFFTQTRFCGVNKAVAAVRNTAGSMGLVTIDLNSGVTDILVPFSFNVLGYPFVQGDTVYFTAMHGYADQTFAADINSKKIFQLTKNDNGVYAPAVNRKNELVVSAFTSWGYRLAAYHLQQTDWQEVEPASFIQDNEQYVTGSVAHYKGYNLLDKLDMNPDTALANTPVTTYRKSVQLFNFHSWRPVVEDPEYGYRMYSDNILSTLKTAISVTYNRTDRSYTLGYQTAFAGWLPVFTVGAESSFNRTVDTAFGKSVTYNAATLKAGVSVPLRFINGRTMKYLQFGTGYNLEQYYYRGVGKNIFSNKSINYINAFINFSHIGQQAMQHVNPRWAQAVSINYRDALNFRKSHKLVMHGSFYFPGLMRNHSLVLQTAFQSRDSLPDLFSKNFAYSRGYEALSTRQMFKWGINYQLPVCYPDVGFGNLLFCQRIRANMFYDFTNAKARVNNNLTHIKNRSAGTEFYFDLKIWNAFPVSPGIRYTHLLDTDLLNPSVRNRWEIIIPISLIPD